MFYVVPKLKFLALNVLIMLSKLLKEARWCSIDIMLRLECLCCPIHLLVLFLMIFTLRKLRSPDDFLPVSEKSSQCSGDVPVAILRLIFINRASHFSGCGDL